MIYSKRIKNDLIDNSIVDAFNSYQKSYDEYFYLNKSVANILTREIVEDIRDEETEAVEVDVRGLLDDGYCLFTFTNTFPCSSNLYFNNVTKLPYELSYVLFAKFSL